MLIKIISIVGVIAICSMVYMSLGLILKIINWISLGNIYIEKLLKGLFLGYLIYKILLPSYPMYDKIYVSYTPEKIYATKHINTWYKVSNGKYIYIDKLDKLKPNNRVRLYYKIFVFNHFNKIVLNNVNGNSYTEMGCVGNSGFLVRSFITECQNVNDKFYVKVDGKNLKLPE